MEIGDYLLTASYDKYEQYQETVAVERDRKTDISFKMDPIKAKIRIFSVPDNADIYVGEGQTLGNYMQYGGPIIGLMAIKEKYKRRMPGRIIGKTIDSRVDILKIVDEGKIKIKELTSLQPNYSVPHDHNGDGIPDH